MGNGSKGLGCWQPRLAHRGASGLTQQLLLVVAVVALACSACGLNMQKNYRKLRPALLKRDYGAANEYVDSVKKEFYGKKNRLLYYMDKGMVLHLAGRYKESNTFVEKAKATAEELWTESVTTHAAAWLTTDNTLPYQGEDFEKVLIHFVAALNYMGLRRYEDARVEARQISNKLELYNSKYEESKSVYRDDAFARWLSGKLAETEGGFSALNDAWIDYKKAIAVYEGEYGRYRTRLPEVVVADALRVVEGLGADFAAEFRALRERHPSVRFVPQSEAKALAEIVVLHLAGEAPYKIDKFWTSPAPDGVIRIAYPEFVAKPHSVRRARVSVRGQQASADTELVEDITAIAIQDLSDHMVRIKAKAIARSLSKYAASQGLVQGGKAVAKKEPAVGAAMAVAGVLFNVGSAIAEEADKRSWITLPSAVGVARLWVPPGEHVVDVSFAGGAAVPFKVKAEAGKTTFLSYRTYQ